MTRIFAYIPHKDGTVDDAAAELISAAKQIDATSCPVAILTGFGSELDAACNSLSHSYAEIWKVTNEALRYPNAELIRKALIDVLPYGCILLLPHNHFGIDLSPGLSIKLNAAFVSDVVNIEGVGGTILRLVRQEFGGQVSTHVHCDISSGAVLSIRPGALKPAGDSGFPDCIIDKSAAVGALNTKRRYVETIVADAGDVDISKEPVLVSIGRGIQERGNVAIAQELADAMRCGELLPARGGCQMARKITASGLVRQDRQAEGLYGLRNQRFFSAPGRYKGQSIPYCRQQKS